MKIIVTLALQIYSQLSEWEKIATYVYV